MRVTRFSGFVIVCPKCSNQSRAATLLIARRKDRAHGVTCDARAKKQLDEHAARAAQGDLFGGGS